MPSPLGLVRFCSVLFCPFKSNFGSGVNASESAPHHKLSGGAVMLTRDMLHFPTIKIFDKKIGPCTQIIIHYLIKKNHYSLNHEHKLLIYSV